MSGLIGSLYLCKTTISNPAGDERDICALRTDRATSYVFALIGLILISTSLYLFLGNIGTIPACAFGCSSLVAGLAFVIACAVRFCKRESVKENFESVT